MKRRGHWAMTLHHTQMPHQMPSLLYWQWMTMAAAAALITTFDAMLSCDMVEWSCSLQTKVGRKELPDREKMKGTNLATKSAAKHFSKNFVLTCTQKRWQRNCWGCEMLYVTLWWPSEKRSTHFLVEQSLSFHPSSSSSLVLSDSCPFRLPNRLLLPTNTHTVPAIRAANQIEI